MLLGDVIDCWRKEESVWVAVPVNGPLQGFYRPKRCRIRCVGTTWVVLDGARDSLPDFCYASKEQCFERCRDLYNIITRRSRIKYPIKPRVA